MYFTKYNERHWAVYDDYDTLICLTVYKKGALEVIKRLQEGFDNPTKAIMRDAIMQGDRMS